MKKLLLVVVILLVSLNANAGWFTKDKPKAIDTPPIVTFGLLDLEKGVDHVFKITEGTILNVAIIDYTEYKIIYLTKGLSMDFEVTILGDDKDEKRKNLDDKIRKAWPGVDRIKIF